MRPLTHIHIQKPSICVWCMTTETSASSTFRKQGKGLNQKDRQIRCKWTCCSWPSCRHWAVAWIKGRDRKVFFILYCKFKATYINKRKLFNYILEITDMLSMREILCIMIDLEVFDQEDLTFVVIATVSVVLTRVVTRTSAKGVSTFIPAWIGI